MLGGFIILCYQSIVSMKLKKYMYIVCTSAVFSVYMSFSHAYIPEPFRVIFGAAFIGALLWICQRKLNVAALVLALLVGYISWYISVFVFGIIYVILVGYDESNIEF